MTARRGIDTVEHLMAWLQARGQQRIVLRLVDVLDLPLAHQQRVAIWNNLVPGHDPAALRLAFQHLAREGYLTIERNKLASFTMTQVQQLMALLDAYKAIRVSKAYYTQEEACACRSHPCPICHGAKVIHTLMELDENEKRLAS